MAISGTEILMGDAQVLTKAKDGVTVQGNVVKIFGQSGNHLSMCMENGAPALKHNHSSSQSCGFYFNDGNTVYKFINASGEKETLSLSQNGMQVFGTITFSNPLKTVNFEYKPSEGGYDLYVTQSDEQKECEK
jgi:hypothetical protein